MNELASSQVSLLAELEKRFYFVPETVAVTFDGRVYPLNEMSTFTYYTEMSVPLLVHHDELHDAAVLRQRIAKYLNHCAQNFKEHIKTVLEKYVFHLQIAKANINTHEGRKRLEDIARFGHLITNTGYKENVVLMELIDMDLNKFFFMEPAELIEKLAVTHVPLKTSVDEIGSQAIQLLQTMNVNALIKSEVKSQINHAIEKLEMQDVIKLALSSKDLRIIVSYGRKEHRHVLGYTVNSDMHWEYNPPQAYFELNVQAIFVFLSFDKDQQLRPLFIKPWLLGGGIMAYDTNVNYHDLFNELHVSPVPYFLEEIREFAIFPLRNDEKTQYLFQADRYQEIKIKLTKKCDEIEKLAKKIIYNEKLTRKESLEWDKIREILQEEEFDSAPRLVAKSLEQREYSVGDKMRLDLKDSVGILIDGQIQYISEAFDSMGHLMRMAILQVAPITKFDDLAYANLVLEFLFEVRGAWIHFESDYQAIDIIAEIYGRMPAFQLRYPGLSDRYLSELMTKVVNPINRQIKNKVTHKSYVSLTQEPVCEGRICAGQHSSSFSNIGQYLHRKGQNGLSQENFVQTKNNFSESSFDFVDWNCNKIHPDTGQPIHTYKFYSAGVEVGSVELHQVPFICRSEEGMPRNLLKTEGIFELIKSDEICDIVLPTFKDKIISTSNAAVGLGLYKGVCETFVHYLEKKGVSPFNIMLLYAVVNCGGLYLFSQGNQTSMLSAIPEMVELAMVGALFNLISQFADNISRCAINYGWNNVGHLFQLCGRFIEHGIYGYMADKQHDSDFHSMEERIAKDTVAILVGGITQQITGYVGKQVINRFFLWSKSESNQVETKDTFLSFK